MPHRARYRKPALRFFATPPVEAGRGLRRRYRLFVPGYETVICGWNSSGGAARAMENSRERAVTAGHAATLAPFLRADEMYRLRGNFRRLTGRDRIPPARPLKSHSKTAKPGFDLAEIAAVCSAVPQSH